MISGRSQEKLMKMFCKLYVQLMKINKNSNDVKSNY